MTGQEILSGIRTVPDFPKPGILFYDITTVLGDAKLYSAILDKMMAPFASKGIDLVCGIESRGFIFGAAIAARMGAGFVPIRKPGKLPYKTCKRSYALEYGSDSLEMHIDAIKSGQKVVLIDDLLATGGTAKAAVELIEELGCKVEAISFLMELKDLGGRNKFEGFAIHSVLQV